MAEKFYIPVYISNDKYDPTEVSPRLLFFNGTKSSIDWYINYNNAFTTVKKYPYMDIYSGNIPSETSKSLLFYNEDAIFGTKPTDSLYTKFWSKYISTLYNNKTRLLECNAVIPFNDYVNLVLNDIIEFRGNYYHLRSINDYNICNGECKVELLGPIIYDSLGLTVQNYVILPTLTELTWTYSGYNVTLNSSVLDEGSSFLTAKGFVYSTINNIPTINDTVINKNTDIAPFSTILTVNDDVVYYVRAFAQNNGGVSYSSVVQVKVNVAMLAPQVITNNATNVTNNDATFNGEILSVGSGTSIISRGFCWSSTNTTPTISDTHQAVNGTLGTFSYSIIDGLIPGTLYYYRAYAQGEYGYGYGTVKTFIAQDKNYDLIVRINNNSGYDLSEISVVVNSTGWSSSEEAVFVTNAYAVEEALFANPIKNSYTTTFTANLIRNNNIIDSWELNDLNYNSMQLISETYVSNLQATGEFYITDDNGQNIVYIDIYIITKISILPSVSLSNYTYSGYNVTLTGDVSSEGSESLIERGFVYSTTNTTPTINDTKIIIGGTLGSYTSNLTVNDSTHYYIRAYAKNDIGIQYSSTINNVYITLSMLIPTVSTNAVTYITNNDAVFNGNVTSQGNSVIIERGFVYNTTGNPTTSDNKVTVSGTTGSYNKELLNTFTTGVTYYVKAFARNIFGTAYGNQVSFIPVDKEYTLYFRVNNFSSYDMTSFIITMDSTGWNYTEQIDLSPISNSSDWANFEQKIKQSYVQSFSATLYDTDKYINNWDLQDFNGNLLTQVISGDTQNNYASGSFNIVTDNGQNNIYVDFTLYDL